MIYIIGSKSYNGNIHYICFDANTESTFDGNAGDLTRWINNGINITNAELINNKLVIVDKLSGMYYSGGISHRADCTLLCKMSENKFKIVNNIGKVSYIEKELIYAFIKRKKVVNCEIRDNKLISVGDYTIIEDNKLEKSIAEKYALYVAKTALLGQPMSFEYTIEGRQVKLDDYTGTSKTVIVPKFITAIRAEAFKACGLEALTLDRGIEYIGKYAFKDCNIAEVTIPDTVKIIGRYAFRGNKKIMKEDGTYTDNIKILSGKTKIIE